MDNLDGFISGSLEKEIVVYPNGDRRNPHRECVAPCHFRCHHELGSASMVLQPRLDTTTIFLRRYFCHVDGVGREVSFAGFAEEASFARE